MQEKIKHISQNNNSNASSLVLANVLQAQNGEATQIILLENSQQYAVIAHGAEVSVLNEGDQVLAVLTNTGAIITHRLRKPGEMPQQGFVVRKDGALEVDNANGINIKANNSHISIDKTGRIFVDGKEIYSFAVGVNRLQGATIELN